jgi:hypothetical protein
LASANNAFTYLSPLVGGFGATVMMAMRDPSENDGNVDRRLLSDRRVSDRRTQAVIAIAALLERIQR